MRCFTVGGCVRAAMILLMSGLMLAGGGCFSMGPVPPTAGLNQDPRPDGHDGASIDARASAEVESDWGQDATFVLVHPTINGKDVGWFILDTGASGCTITGAAAERGGLKAVGTTRIQGETQSAVFECAEVRLGRLTLSGLHMTGLNMSHSSSVFGREIAGILGQNVFACAIVELDGPGRAVRLHDPEGDSDIDAMAAYPIEMRGKLPHVKCSYAGVDEGMFMVDSGANTAVHFLAGAVAEHGLMNAPGVSMTGTKTQQTFGRTTTVSEGRVEDFRIGGQPGGRQFGPLSATFSRPADGPSRALREADGVIGMGLMSGFTVYFNEPKGRLSIEGTGGKGTGPGGVRK